MQAINFLHGSSHGILRQPLQYDISTPAISMIRLLTDEQIILLDRSIRLLDGVWQVQVVSRDFDSLGE